jgi:hypothetical protein
MRIIYIMLEFIGKSGYNLTGVDDNNLRRTRMRAELDPVEFIFQT